MGVPRFFRWLTLRYPMVNQSFNNANAAPLFDNLYIDANGIIHNVSHNNDKDDKNFAKLSELDIFARTAQYIDQIFTSVQPRKLLYIAIDGVAPRAKMNQQRQRRFQTAKNESSEYPDSDHVSSSDVNSSNFDSNCITPGTLFMSKLGDFIKFFIAQKMNQDARWQEINVIFSGHDVPGEGEHKIMEYIRYQKSIPGYNPNLSHVIYGLDADLILLALATHEPHFALIREYSVLVNPSNHPSQQFYEFQFHLTHIGLLREYFQLEFEVVKSDKKLIFGFDLERIIDDIVLMSLFVGNDFFPRMSSMEINEGSLDLLFAAYKELLPSMGGYLTDKAEINLKRLEMLLTKFSQCKNLLDSSIPENPNQSSHNKIQVSTSLANVTLTNTNSPEIDISKNKIFDFLNRIHDMQDIPAELANLLYQARQSDSGDEDDTLQLICEQIKQIQLKHQDNTNNTDTLLSSQKDDQSISYNSAYEQMKIAYYRDKLHIEPHEVEKRFNLVKSYLESIYWVLNYYFNGCISWSWYYPYHYAPIITDFIKLEEFLPHIHFTSCAPFTPIQQLLAVLPPVSSSLLPLPFQKFLVDPSSPLYPFCSMDFKLDPNGKRNTWEYIALLPFVDEKTILEISELVPLENLSPEEIRANTLGQTCIYHHDKNNRIDIPSPFPSFFKPLNSCPVGSEVYIHPIPKDPKLNQFSKLNPNLQLLDSFKLLPGALLNTFKPSTHPTFASIPVQAALQQNSVSQGVKIKPFECLFLQLRPNGWGPQGGPDLSPNRLISFDYKSSYSDPFPLDMDSISGMLLNELCYVWPYHREALVVSISNEHYLCRNGSERVAFNREEQLIWHEHSSEMSHHYQDYFGLAIGEIKSIVEIRYLDGLKYSSNGDYVKRWSSTTSFVPYQLFLTEHPIGIDPRFVENTALPIEIQYPKHKSILCLRRGKYFGQVGRILDYENDHTASVLVCNRTNLVWKAPFLRSLEDNWIRDYQLALKFRIEKPILSQILSSFRLDMGKHNCGLRLRSKTMQTMGYSRKITYLNQYTNKLYSYWEYSDLTASLLNEFRQKFPELFDFFISITTSDKIYSTKLFIELATQKNHGNLKKLGQLATKKFFASSLNQSVPTENQNYLKQGISPESATISSDLYNIQADLVLGNHNDDKGSISHQSQFDANAYFTLVREWIDNHPSSKSLRLPHGTSAFSPTSVAKIVQAIDQWNSSYNQCSLSKHVRLVIPRSDLLPPLNISQTHTDITMDVLEESCFQLGDRVVCPMDSGPFLFGEKATVIAVRPDSLDLLLDNKSIDGSNLNDVCPPYRGVSLPPGSVINITAPIRNFLHKSNNSYRQNTYQSNGVAKVEQQLVNSPNKNFTSTVNVNYNLVSSKLATLNQNISLGSMDNVPKECKNSQIHNKIDSPHFPSPIANNEVQGESSITLKKKSTIEDNSATYKYCKPTNATNPTKTDKPSNPPNPNNSNIANGNHACTNTIASGKEPKSKFQSLNAKLKKQDHYESNHKLFHTLPPSKSIIPTSESYPVVTTTCKVEPQLSDPNNHIKKSNLKPYDISQHKALPITSAKKTYKLIQRYVAKDKTNLNSNNLKSINPEQSFTNKPIKGLSITTQQSPTSAPSQPNSTIPPLHSLVIGSHQSTHNPEFSPNQILPQSLEMAPSFYSNLAKDSNINTVLNLPSQLGPTSNSTPSDAQFASLLPNMPPINPVIHLHHLYNVANNIDPLLVDTNSQLSPQNDNIPSDPLSSNNTKSTTDLFNSPSPQTVPNPLLSFPLIPASFTPPPFIFSKAPGPFTILTHPLANIPLNQLPFHPITPNIMQNNLNQNMPISQQQLPATGLLNLFTDLNPEKSISVYELFSNSSSTSVIQPDSSTIAASGQKRAKLKKKILHPEPIQPTSSSESNSTANIHQGITKISSPNPKTTNIKRKSKLDPATKLSTGVPCAEP